MKSAAVWTCGASSSLDLTAVVIHSEDEFWDAVADPLQLPSWFGRNLNAWDDTVWGGISEVIDSTEELVIRVKPAGLFDPATSPRTQLLEGVTWEHRTARIEVVIE